MRAERDGSLHRRCPVRRQHDDRGPRHDAPNFLEQRQVARIGQTVIELDDIKPWFSRRPPERIFALLASLAFHPA